MRCLMRLPAVGQEHSRAHSHMRNVLVPHTNLVEEHPIDPNPDLTCNLDDTDNRANLGDGDDTYDHDVDQATLKQYVEAFPGPVGDPLRQEQTRFEKLDDLQQLEGKAPWELFASRDEWGLVQWLMRNVGQGSTDEYLKLPIVSFNFC